MQRFGLVKTPSGATMSLGPNLEPTFHFDEPAKPRKKAAPKKQLDPCVEDCGRSEYLHGRCKAHHDLASYRHNCLPCRVG